LRSLWSSPRHSSSSPSTLHLPISSFSRDMRRHKDWGRQISRRKHQMSNLLREILLQEYFVGVTRDAF
jgi:hypothetical protein